MPLAAVPGILRGAVLVACCAAICWTFLLSAQLHNAVPVFLAAASVGGAVVVLPLRFYPLAPFGAAAGWMAACIIALVLWRADDGSLYRRVGTLIVIVTAAAWVVRFALTALAKSKSPTFDRGSVSAAVAVLLAAGAASLIIYGASGVRHLDAFVSLSIGARMGLLVLSALVAGVAVLIAASAAAWDGIGVAVDPEQWFVGMPKRPRPLPRPQRRLPRPIRGPDDPFSRMGRAFARFAEHFAYVATLVMLAVVDALMRLLFWLGVLLVGLMNWLIGWAIILILILVSAARLVFPAVRAAARFVVVPVASLTLSAWWAVSFAETSLIYLTTGGFGEMFALLAFGVGAAISLTVVWLSLCGLPLARSLPSARRSASSAGAITLILIAIGGWVIGLFGTFGNGPIRIGWMTVGSTTTILVIALIGAYRGRVRPDNATT